MDRPSIVKRLPTLLILMGTLGTASAAGSAADAGASSTTAVASRLVTLGNQQVEVPLDYVITPGGLFPPECVHLVKPGENAATEPPCTRPHFTPEGKRVDRVDTP